MFVSWLEPVLRLTCIFKSHYFNIRSVSASYVCASLASAASCGALTASVIVVVTSRLHNRMAIIEHSACNNRYRHYLHDMGSVCAAFDKRHSGQQ